jgi:predicted metal-dependent hydrolase
VSRERPAGYSIRRSSRARRARLTLSRTGDAVVVLPIGAPDGLAADLVGRHSGWLARHQARIRAELQSLAARPALGEGRMLTLRGLEHAVIVVPRSSAGRSRVWLADDSATISIELGAGAAPSRSAAALLEAWLRAEARRDLVSAVAARSAQMGLAPERVAVRDQRTRWGSASGRGTLSFNWRLVMGPPAVLDYVVVHELAHLRWRGHGARFWSLVRRHVRDVEQHRRWLRANHSALRAALD